jgi:mono/diheme cytochrome c family protein
MPLKPLAVMAAGALAIAIATGCSKNSDQSSTTTTTTTESSAPAAGAASPQAAATMEASPGGMSTTAASTVGTASSAQGDPAKGKQIFTANCSSCHGANGQGGGIGPSLVNEKSRKNYDQTVTWIENPQPPMPKLYPSPLSLTDVKNVAAYVQTL